jgi:hypothetical protein
MNKLNAQNCTLSLTQESLLPEFERRPTRTVDTEPGSVLFHGCVSELNQRLRLMLRLRMHGAVHLLPPYVFMELSLIKHRQLYRLLLLIYGIYEELFW